MIRDGDRILLGVSGGKDSLSLLLVLRHLQSYAPVRFDLGVITVDPEVEGFDPSSLTAYYDELEVPWHYRSQPIMDEARTRMQGDSFCAYCARMKRGIMYSTCREHGYNVLALAQHLDDLAESFLMSAFHQGRLETMKAHYRIDAGDLRVIRPFVYVREAQTRDFALAAGLPVVACGSGCAGPSRRVRLARSWARVSPLALSFCTRAMMDCRAMASLLLGSSRRIWSISLVASSTRPTASSWEAR